MSLKTREDICLLLPHTGYKMTCVIICCHIFCVLICAESLHDNAEFGHYLAELSSYGVKRLCKLFWYCVVSAVVCGFMHR